MLRCKEKSLIPDTSANKKLNTAVDEAVDANKEPDIIADKELNAAAKEAIDANKR